MRCRRISLPSTKYQGSYSCTKQGTLIRLCITVYSMCLQKQHHHSDCFHKYVCKAASMQARRLLQRTSYSLRLLVKNAVFVHRVNNVYWTTCIIRHACAVRINYQKGLGPSINTTDPLNFKFQDWCSTIACFWSYVLPK